MRNEPQESDEQAPSKTEQVQDTKQEQKEDIPKETEDSGVQEQETVEDGSQTEAGEKLENPVIEGTRISGYTGELERILEADVETVTKKCRTWLDENGYSGVTGLAFYDTVQVTLAEQKYSVEFQLVYDDSQGNGIQPKGSVIVMDYYKNRGLYQFHA